MTTMRELPAEIRELFWEYDTKSIDFDTHRDFIVERVLAEGGWRAIQWLRSTFGDETIRDVIMRTKARTLTPQQIRYWQLILLLPDSLVLPWLRDERRQIWYQKAG